jgi:hypothetical protein
MPRRETIGQIWKSYLSKSLNLVKVPVVNKLLVGGGIAAAITLGVFIFWFFDKAPLEVAGHGKNLPVSRLTGQPCEQADQRPIAVMLAGDPVARPLSGIGQADIVVEMPVTPNGVTRFMAVFQCEHPSDLGSIRSAREGFLPFAASLGVLYAHWGGEHGALEKLNAGILDNIDALKYEGTTFYRKTDVPMPHNGFSTLEKILDRAGKLKYPAAWNFAGYPHAESKAANNIASLTNRIEVDYPAPFTVRWEYDAATHLYRRLRNGTPEQDTDTNKPVVASVIVVMKTTASPLRDQYLIVNTEGSGEALIYQQGTTTKATWRKDPAKLDSKLTFEDAQGKEIPFAPGKIWINVVAPL